MRKYKVDFHRLRTSHTENRTISNGYGPLGNMDSNNLQVIFLLITNFKNCHDIRLSDAASLFHAHAI